MAEHPLNVKIQEYSTPVTSKRHTDVYDMYDMHMIYIYIYIYIYNKYIYIYI